MSSHQEPSRQPDGGNLSSDFRSPRRGRLLALKAKGADSILLEYQALQSNIVERLLSNLIKT
jgi:hypothetical protein